MDYTIDAKEKRFGRVCSEMAGILQGKHSVLYAPHKIGNDRVILKNYRSLSIGGNKEIDKIYYRHTGYVGHLKERTFGDAFARDPQAVILNAVRRMLPKNFIAAERLKNIIFQDAE